MPFGAERLNEKAGDFETHFTFTDQEKDSESGLLYYGARYYNPSISRFTQVDPVVIDTQRKEFAQALQNPQLLNGYSYVGNNPLKYVDYEGEFVFVPVVIAGFLAVAPSIMTALNIALPMIPAMIAEPGLTGEAAARIAPLSGDAIDIAESATGINAFSGEKLSGFERVLTIGAAALPFVSGGVLRNADDALKNLPTQNHHLLTNKSAETLSKIHGNSLEYPGDVTGYSLRNKTTGDVSKFGETISPKTRYSQKFLEENNMSLKGEITGPKSEIHQWQHNQILDYKETHNGLRPPLNKGNW